MNIRQEITQTLTELCRIYPQMRVGQLVSNIVFWATGPAAESPWEVDDAKFIDAARRHLERRRQQLELEPGPLGEAPEARAALLHCVEDMAHRSPVDSFAKVIQNLALSEGLTPYDIEDSQLQAAALRQPAGESFLPTT